MEYNLVTQISWIDCH